MNKTSSCPKGGGTTPTYVDQWTERQTQKYCEEWYDGKRASGINPMTGRKILREGKVWPKIDRHCQANIKLLNADIFEHQFTPDDIPLPDKDKLKRDIQTMVKECWKNPRLEMRASYNSEDGTQDLFTEKEVQESKNIKCLGGLEAELSTDEELLRGMGHSEHKRPLNDVATDFNTVNFFSGIQSRLRFVKLIIYSLTAFFETVYSLDGKCNRDNLNVMFKGGTTIRFVIREFLRGFSGELENYVLDKIRKTIKLSDYDFEIMSQENLLSKGEVIKINLLSYLVTLRIRNYLVDNREYFFDFFKLRDSVQQTDIQELKTKLQDTADHLTPENFYHGIVIDEIEYDGDCTDPLQRKYSQKLSTSQISKLAKYTDKVDPDSTCRTDFSLVPDATTRTEREVLSLTSNNKICFISSRKLLQKYKIPSQYVKLAIKNRGEGSRFYASHNPLVEFPLEIDHTKKIKFQLNRIKYNYVIYYHKKLANNETVYLREAIVGEILDLSHPYNEDRKKIKFSQPFSDNHYFQKYTFQDYQLSYWSYSVYGLIKDNDEIVFLESNYLPWTASKYEKRLTRVSYLYILYYFSNRFPLPFTKKLRNLKNLIRMIENDFSKKYRLHTTSNERRPIIQEYIQQLERVTRNKHHPDYASYKNSIVAIMHNLYRVLKTEYEITRNPQLVLGQINPLNLALRFPSIY